MDAVVVGFDGSESSFVALDWVAVRAARIPCRVELIRLDPEATVFADDIDEFAFGEAERRLLNVAPHTEVRSRTVRGRMPADLGTAAGAADLVVIGVHRRRPIRAALTGWRSLRTAARSQTPIVVVPDDWTPSDGPVVVGVDDDESSVAAIEYAAREASSSGVGLELLHAWRMPEPAMEGSVALLALPVEEAGAHRRILDAAHARVTAAHPGLNAHRELVQAQPVTALLAAAGHASLIVIGTHHRGVFAGALLGSVAQDAIGASPVPLCIVPAASPQKG